MSFQTIVRMFLTNEAGLPLVIVLTVKLLTVDQWNVTIFSGMIMRVDRMHK